MHKAIPILPLLALICSHLKTFVLITICQLVLAYFEGVGLVKQRSFSLYDIEQFLKEAGAEKINEKAVITLEQELEQTVNELVGEASFYANYAGRKNVIKCSDLELVQPKRSASVSKVVYLRGMRKRPVVRKKSKNRIILTRVRTQ